MPTTYNTLCSRATPTAYLVGVVHRHPHASTLVVVHLATFVVVFVVVREKKKRPVNLPLLVNLWGCHLLTAPCAMQTQIILHRCRHTVLSAVNLWRLNRPHNLPATCVVCVK